MREKELVSALVELKVNDAKIGPMLSKTGSFERYEKANKTSPNFMNPNSALSVRNASKEQLSRNVSQDTNLTLESPLLHGNTIKVMDESIEQQRVNLQTPQITT